MRAVRSVGEVKDKRGLPLHGDGQVKKGVGEGGQGEEERKE